MYATKPIILTFVSNYIPGYKSGGPIRSISNLVEQLGDKLDFYIVTKDRDYLDGKPYKNVNIDNWNEVGNAKVFYASPEKLRFVKLVRFINETKHDVLYLNSFFSYSFSIRLLLARRLGSIKNKPTVIAPRGELLQGTMSLKKWKKSPFLIFARLLGLYEGLTWHASNEFEYNSIISVMSNIATTVIVAPNLPALPNVDVRNFRHLIRSDGTPLRVCFFSRISPEKNLEYALQVVSKIKLPIEFNIYGAISDEGYWQRCKAYFDNIPQNVNIRYHGNVDYKDVTETLTTNDLFFFPTRGENYGHVIFEALAAGLPILISDQTPWRNLKSHGVGWDLPLNNMDEFCSIIEHQILLNDELRMAQRYRAIKYAETIARDPVLRSSNLKMFTDILLNK